MAKRGKNEGSIFQRKDGRWVGSLNLGWEDGKRKRRHFYAQQRRRCKTNCSKLVPISLVAFRSRPSDRPSRNFSTTGLQNP